MKGPGFDRNFVAEYELDAGPYNESTVPEKCAYMGGISCRGVPEPSNYYPRTYDSVLHKHIWNHWCVCGHGVAKTYDWKVGDKYWELGKCCTDKLYKLVTPGAAEKTLSQTIARWGKHAMFKQLSRPPNPAYAKSIPFILGQIALWTMKGTAGWVTVKHLPDKLPAKFGGGTLPWMMNLAPLLSFAKKLTRDNTRTVTNPRTGEIQEFWIVKGGYRKKEHIYWNRLEVEMALDDVCKMLKAYKEKYPDWQIQLQEHDHYKEVVRDALIKNQVIQP